MNLRLAPEDPIEGASRLRVNFEGGLARVTRPENAVPSAGRAAQGYERGPGPRATGEDFRGNPRGPAR